MDLPRWASFGSVIGRGDVGEEVGGVVEERVELDAKLPDDDLRQLVLDGSAVPSRLTQSIWSQKNCEVSVSILRPGKRRWSEVLAAQADQPRLDRGLDGAIECAKQQRRADRQPRRCSGDMLVDDGDHAEAIGGGLEGRDVAVLERADAQPPSGCLEEALEQRVGGAEVERRERREVCR